jgi:hypothetical protein
MYSRRIFILTPFPPSIQPFLQNNLKIISDMKSAYTPRYIHVKCIPRGFRLFRPRTHFSTLFFLYPKVLKMTDGTDIRLCRKCPAGLNVSKCKFYYVYACISNIFLSKLHMSCFRSFVSVMFQCSNSILKYPYVIHKLMSRLARKEQRQLKVLSSGN